MLLLSLLRAPERATLLPAVYEFTAQFFGTRRQSCAKAAPTACIRAEPLEVALWAHTFDTPTATRQRLRYCQRRTLRLIHVRNSSLYAIVGKRRQFLAPGEGKPSIDGCKGVLQGTIGLCHKRNRITLAESEC